MPQSERSLTYPQITHNFVTRFWRTEEFTPDQMVRHFSKLAAVERYTGVPTDQEPTRALKDAAYSGMTKR